MSNFTNLLNLTNLFRTRQAYNVASGVSLRSGRCGGYSCVFSHFLCLWTKLLAQFYTILILKPSLLVRNDKNGSPGRTRLLHFPLTSPFIGLGIHFRFPSDLGAHRLPPIVTTELLIRHFSGPLLFLP